MQPIRLAVIGRGRFSRYFLEAVSRVPELVYVGQYSRHLADAQAFATEYGGTLWWDDLNALAGDPQVDAVYIGSPNAFHAPQAITLLNAGKHVLCEKPVASHLREWQDMCAAADSSGTTLLEAMRLVHCPGFALLRELLPELGTIRQVDLCYCQYSSRYDNFKKGIIENAFRPELSNGSLMDIGVYCVYAMITLFGTPHRLHASAVKLSNGIDGAGSVLAEYDGMQVSLLHSKINDGRCSAFLGENGMLETDIISHPSRFTLTRRDGSVQHFAAQQEENDMVYEARHFAQLIRQGGGEHYRRWSTEVMTVMDEIRRQTGIRFPADDQI